ncbi:MAG: hypothetical protein WBB85_11965, partial [Albidovulum sp.]|uniref:hypothetical protein n=1 Tax=Albidovulum sp. TaxID=1872424 RepID=UPI003C99EE8D
TAPWTIDKNQVWLHVLSELECGKRSDRTRAFQQIAKLREKTAQRGLIVHIRDCVENSREVYFCPPLQAIDMH